MCENLQFILFLSKTYITLTSYFVIFTAFSLLQEE